MLDNNTLSELKKFMDEKKSHKDQYREQVYQHLCQQMSSLHGTQHGKFKCDECKQLESVRGMQTYISEPYNNQPLFLCNKCFGLHKQKGYVKPPAEQAFHSTSVLITNVISRQQGLKEGLHKCEQCKAVKELDILKDRLVRTDRGMIKTMCADCFDKLTEDNGFDQLKEWEIIKEHIAQKGDLYK